MAFIKVDFPAPLGPNIPTKAPAGRLRSTFQRTGFWWYLAFRSCTAPPGPCTCSIILLQVFYNTFNIGTDHVNVSAGFSPSLSQAIRVKGASKPDSVASLPTAFDYSSQGFRGDGLLYKNRLNVFFNNIVDQFGNISEAWLTQGGQALQTPYLNAIRSAEIGKGIMSSDQHLSLGRYCFDRFSGVPV